MGCPGLGERRVKRVVQDDLQGNVLCGYGRKYAHGLFLFFRIEDRRAFGRWLDGQAGSITTAVPWGKPDPPSTLNVALSLEGLEALGLRQGLLDSFPEEFRQGMEKRAPRLGDMGTSEPQRWDERLKGLHGVVTVLALERAVRDARRAELEAEAADAGLEIPPFAQETDVPADEREPFGFADGISQPAIRDPAAGPWPRPGDEPVAPGEFVLGYEDEGGVVPEAPAGIGFNGSYMVVRKLEQDVEGFRDFLRVEAEGDAASMDWLAAKIVGRWRDGTPLVRSPEGPDGDGAARDALNDFTYGADPEGFRCPIGAHIRRTNPRDSLDSEWRFTNRHRIIRRGMPYTPDGDGRKPGLIFVCFQASIERQFEFVQSQWMGDGNAFSLGSDPDFIAGPSAGKMTIQGAPPRFVPMQRFVTTRGGGYFFVPGMSALRHIAELARA
jgi:Dyp-type peroxidase family